MAFTGELAVVTGGGSGMGQTWARKLAEDGATVVLIDINAEGMEATASGFENVHVHVVDITDSDIKLIAGLVVGALLVFALWRR